MMAKATKGFKEQYEGYAHASLPITSDQFAQVLNFRGIAEFCSSKITGRKGKAHERRRRGSPINIST